MPEQRKIHSVTALFNRVDELVNAVNKTADSGYTRFDANTPYPVHGMDRAMRLKQSKLGFVTLFFGLSGVTFAFLMMAFMMAVDYPLVIGGKPFLALPAYGPIMFELTVLFAALATVAGMISLFNKLPSNSHPHHDTNYMRNVSSDKFGISIEAEDPKFEQKRVISFLKELGGEDIEIIYYPEKIKIPVLQPRFIMFLFVTFIAVSGLTYLTLNKLLFLPPFDWMEFQERLNAQEGSDLFDNGIGMRVPVEGTVARGFLPYEFAGVSEPSITLVNPVLITKESLQLGREKFLTFCSPCHGNYGDGDSRLKGAFPAPPTLHSNKVREWDDGRIYHVITNGQNIMPSYAAQVTREERWAIVNYIRVLQRAKNADQTDIEFAKKEALKDASQ